jgi:MoaA/NifB/PqqE/SkfB family radical SAM enzyme
MMSLADATRRYLTLRTHHVYTLPIVILMPHSRCNCRCVMCDIWKANANGQEISADRLAPHVESLRRLGVRWVTLSGGEALMHSHLWRLCDMLRPLGVRVTLLSTGLLLEPHAADVVRWCDEVIVSLDGSRQIHDAIRQIPCAYDRLAAGVAALRRFDPRYRVTARSVLQRRNCLDLPAIIDAAHDLRLDQISFLAADVSSTAFNRPDGWDAARTADVALDPAGVVEFERVLEETITAHAPDFASGFVAESPDKLRRIPKYFAALNGHGDFPPVRCNAPWVSTVIEADGTVRPCYFHRALGNIHEKALGAILNSDAAVEFRRRLDMRTDETCRRCVCSLHVRPTKPLAPR